MQHILSTASGAGLQTEVAPLTQCIHTLVVTRACVGGIDAQVNWVTVVRRMAWRSLISITMGRGLGGQLH